ncbi:MAG: riboflavin synthase subunit alpha [Acidobacteria bacterium RIFCSPLOWO2_02_FULL_68_18]|nr:MAG: riboflavin synthase subunit alpha [Acidobacteria bacterium RIFCSPLOWO2_02_FULL_68_18]OFW49443.1 MAG: riboflavin synthase subunit alpha [Acidobacteria bacterium RIFCSPLOWO2_12_FULL_68_19]
MFTGLIEAVGRAADVQRTAAGLRLRIATALASEMTCGDSLGVNGVCLTVVTSGGGHVECDVGPETMRVTTLGMLQGGEALNLERPMRADGRVGGHFVLGHVDGTGRVVQIREDGDARRLTVAFSADLGPYLVSKGSVAVDGISLTIAALGERTFEVMIVPYTWEHTNLQGRAAGDPVNLECDVIGKYVVRAAGLAAGTDSGRYR